ncbi:MAG: RloB family protein [Gammaproteobacteria bacterium]|nr:RloB family protein [Gammaproteobacteria bacterium]
MARRKIPPIQRRQSRREPKRRFFLFCEGKNTEPAYFHALKLTLTGTLITVETRPGVGVPKTIATEAVKFAQSQGLTKKSRRKKNSFEENDEVWAVFDRDDHPNFDEAVSQCEANGVGVARSNPCFELWLILHERDYDRFDHRAAVQRELKKLRPEYDKRRGKIPDCDDLVTRVELAEERGKVLIERREEERKPHGNPSTTVGMLTCAIRIADKSARR